MAQIETWFEQDLKKPVKVHTLNGNVFTLDNAGSLIGVKVYDDGSPATLSGSVNGYIILPDDTTVSVAGTRSENKAYIALPQSALAYPGFIRIAIKLTNNSEITTLLAVIAIVVKSRTDTIITPSQQIITDWSQQIAAEMQAVEDASAAQDAKIDELKNALSSEDDLVNDAHSYVNYDYGTPFYQVEDPSGGWSKKTGIDRSGPVVVLNKSTAINYSLRIKLSGSVAQAVTESGMAGWTSGVSLKTGHEYVATVKLLSGVCYKETSEDGIVPICGIYRAGESSNIGEVVESAGITKSYFTAEENTNYNIALYINKNKFVFTNAKLLVTLEDLTESEIVKINTDISNLEDRADVIEKTLYYSPVALIKGNITPTGIAGSNNAYIRTISGQLLPVTGGNYIVLDGDYELYNAEVFTNNNISSKGYQATIPITDSQHLIVPDDYIGKYVGVTIKKTSMIGQDISSYVADAEEHIRFVNTQEINQKVNELDERVENLETGDSIPSYYYDDDYIDERAKAINTIGCGLGRKALRYFFITDYHYEDNARNSPLLISYLISKTGIKNVMFGGDAYNSAWGSKVGGYEKNCIFLDDFRNVRKDGNL